jgi:hypothetical protein
MMDYLKIACYGALTLACLVYVLSMADDEPEDRFYYINSEIKELQADVLQMKHDMLKMH